MHTSYHAKIQFLHNHIVEIPRSVFFFDKAQDSCVRVVSQVFTNQLSRSSCSIDNPYNISYMKSCCIVCRICGTLPLRLICFRSFQQNIALRVLSLILLLVFNHIYSDGRIMYLASHLALKILNFFIWHQVEISFPR